MTEADFPRRVVRRPAQPPRPPESTPDLQALEISSLSAEEAHDEIALTGLALSGQRAGGVTFRNARWVNVDLSGSRLEQLGLGDCLLSGCNLANLQGRQASFTRVAIESCRLTGIDLPEAALQDLTVRDSRIDLASFSFSRLARVTFEDCLLTQTTFLDAELDSVRFHRCDLTSADFRGARLRACEFRGSDLTGAEGVHSLRGAAMEWTDIIEMAGVWAAALGIAVLDDD
jgi:uncharacterized protein YjbI with pentapeptide repeats